MNNKKSLILVLRREVTTEDLIVHSHGSVEIDRSYVCIVESTEDDELGAERGISSESGGLIGVVTGRLLPEGVGIVVVLDDDGAASVGEGGILDKGILSLRSSGICIGIELGGVEATAGASNPAGDKSSSSWVRTCSVEPDNNLRT